MTITRTCALSLLALLTALPGCDRSDDDLETSGVVSPDEDEAEDEASFAFVGDGTIDRGQVVDVHLSCQ